MSADENDEQAILCKNLLRIAQKSSKKLCNSAKMCIFSKHIIIVCMGNMNILIISGHGEQEGGKNARILGGNN